MAEHTDQNQVSYKDTLNLPHTDFPIRANPIQTDPGLIMRWQEEGLYQKTFDLNRGNEKFILHDGPPYANGHIHLGHAYNKILKDIILKSKRMTGLHTPCMPGWDCHGLPIELKVSQENPGVSAHELKSACRAYAQHWIDIQRQEFKNLGVLMDWDRPYLTMSFEYEQSILEAFAFFVSQGYIERKNKTVPWCISCKTVLAAAEIEYEERKDPSLYVTFALEESLAKKLLPQLGNATLNVLVWTTTPWTLPLNRAVLIRPNESYSILKLQQDYIIVGTALVQKICDMLQITPQVVDTINADGLIASGARLHHPFIADLLVPLLPDNSVELSEGTAFVHCAPGAGPIDYEIGVRNNLEIYSPVTADGIYTQDVQPHELAGMSITDGQGWVMKRLLETNRLVHKTSLRHSYPHCWRCHKGLIFRATKQWFFDLAKGDIKNKTLAVIKYLKMYPESSRNRLSSTVDGRLEWCISRQRVWGVPIPALICTQCDYTYMNADLIGFVAKQVGNQGIEYWNVADVSSLIPADCVCHSCGAFAWQKEMDILDVWFESGVSNYAVLKKEPALQFPADLYVEGKDQHRAWFQSSLLISMALNNDTCSRGFVTHGFTVDAQGKKMSKSLGNGVEPQDIIKLLGTDGLRLWVASIDYTDDAVVSDVLMKNVQEVLRKIRNTCRFLLSNLYDFNINTDAVSFDNLRMIDQYALQELVTFNQTIIGHYQAYNFTAVFHNLADYCSGNLSSFYLDIVKDRLYVEKANGPLRRGAQTVCWYILDTLTKLMAPILSFTAEQLSDHYQRGKKESIHLQSFAHLQGLAALKVQDKKRWEFIKELRSALLKAIEQQRAVGMIKHPLEAQLVLAVNFDGQNKELFDAFIRDLATSDQSLEDFLKDLVIVSRVSIRDAHAQLPESILPSLRVEVLQAEGKKCPRCWQYDTMSHNNSLCSRCALIVE
jgi:isoleucyl-tRNA synthetase